MKRLFFSVGIVVAMLGASGFFISPMEILKREKQKKPVTP